MAKIYYDLIQANLRSIDQVPIIWREDTLSMLKMRKDIRK